MASIGEKVVKGDTPFDFMLLLYGWMPIIGHLLALINYLMGKKRRAKFLLVYATAGIIPFVFMIIANQ